jgi:hypothetical protein
MAAVEGHGALTESLTLGVVAEAHTPVKSGKLDRAVQAAAVPGLWMGMRRPGLMASAAVEAAPD